MKLGDLFEIRYGQKEYHNKENLDKGDILVISSQASDNGCYGFFDAKPKFKAPFITAPSTGSIGYACVQLVDCAVADDALVLTPLDKVAIEYLFYVAAAIRKSRWRYNYGRKITPQRLSLLDLIQPSKIQIQTTYSSFWKKYYPKKETKKLSFPEIYSLKEVAVTDLFTLERGDFHAIDRLEPGIYPTISRVSSDNGLVGFYKKPKNAKIYTDTLLTVSTVTGDTFLQFYPFIATDNVLLCFPKKKYRLTTLVYIQSAINKVKWRYSYGRQCYKRIFQKTAIHIPYDKSNEIDEDCMEQIVSMSDYWNYFKKQYLN